MPYTTFLKLTLCAGAMLILAGCATPATTTTAAAANTTAVATTPNGAEPMFTVNYVKAADAEADQICKEQEIVGSRFTRTLCGTAEQWEDVATENRKQFRDIHRRSSQQTRPN
ncbi:hypothetical protein GCM10011309_02180 [Litorimonas cladophorae]|uniref:Lipoprotein n=1 Tax=Litorimonas cladophorae TaxID=1220491 RepID=A0A918KBD3_9PROT|nr:hypothetical protein [Litorimonas cladophorae]GGX56872.1 hypothetical protein GCM10011309_02180 [Litorimonas cladophorae]